MIGHGLATLVELGVDEEAEPEGLQHEDGHSHLAAATVPNIVAYDPAFGYELAVIMQQMSQGAPHAMPSCCNTHHFWFFLTQK